MYDGNLAEARKLLQVKHWLVSGYQITARRALLLSASLPGM